MFLYSRRTEQSSGNHGVPSEGWTTHQHNMKQNVGAHHDCRRHLHTLTKRDRPLYISH